ncbi:30S ribosomal protein S14 [Candidatus Micrarchaeota archaeon]|nr:30S ribosomal protein S14 [Candidatus Micrarchaeota archaeon]
MSKRTLDRMKKGKIKYRCKICGSTHSVIHQYGLNICRKCFREVGEKIGFRKY